MKDTNIMHLSPFDINGGLVKTVMMMIMMMMIMMMMVMMMIFLVVESLFTSMSLPPPAIQAKDLFIRNHNGFGGIICCSLPV